MAVYRVARTDMVGDGEFTEAIVSAKGRLQARKLITAQLNYPEGGSDAQYAGVNPDGSNLLVERLEDGRDTPNTVLIAAYYG